MKQRWKKLLRMTSSWLVRDNYYYSVCSQIFLKAWDTLHRKCVLGHVQPRLSFRTRTNQQGSNFKSLRWLLLSLVKILLSCSATCSTLTSIHRWAQLRQEPMHDEDYSNYTSCHYCFPIGKILFCCPLSS